MSTENPLKYVLFMIILAKSSDVIQFPIEAERRVKRKGAKEPSYLTQNNTMREREKRNEERGRKRRKVSRESGLVMRVRLSGNFCQKFLLTATYIVQSYDDVFKRAIVYVGVGKVARVKRRLVSASRFSLRLSLSVCT